MKDDISEAIDLMDEDIHELENFHPVELVDSTPRTGSIDAAVDSSMDKLAEKYNLNSPVTRTEDILRNIDQISSEDKRTFDLMASKMVSETHSRAMLKATLAMDMAIDKMADQIFNVDSADYQADPMSFLMLLEKFQGYIEKSNQYSKQYMDPTVDESLKVASEAKDNNTNDKLSPSEYADIVNDVLGKIRSEK